MFQVIYHLFHNTIINEKQLQNGTSVIITFSCRVLQICSLAASLNCNDCKLSCNFFVSFSSCFNFSTCLYVVEKKKNLNRDEVNWNKRNFVEVQEEYIPFACIWKVQRDQPVCEQDRFRFPALDLQNLVNKWSLQRQQSSDLFGQTSRSCNLLLRFTFHLASFIDKKVKKCSVTIKIMSILLT